MANADQQHNQPGQSGQQGQGQQGQSGQDPNREPGSEELYNRDKQGNVFYDKDTEIRRESQFGNATGQRIGEENKVDSESDEFKNQKK